MPDETNGTKPPAPQPDNSAAEPGATKPPAAKAEEPVLTAPEEPKTPIQDLAFLPFGELLLLAGRDGNVRLWDAAARELLYQVKEGRFGLDAKMGGSLTWYFAVKEGIFVRSDSVTDVNGAISVEAAGMTLGFSGQQKSAMALAKK